MNGDGDVVPLPERGPQVDVDRRTAPEPRPGSEILKEGLLALPHLLVLLSRLLRDPAVPRGRKWVAGLAALYAISPIDLIPDRIPVVGKVDDVVVVAFALDYLIAGTPRRVVLDHWPGSQDALELVAGIVAWVGEFVPGAVRNLAERVERSAPA